MVISNSPKLLMENDSTLYARKGTNWMLDILFYKRLFKNDERLWEICGKMYVKNEKQFITATLATFRKWFA